jgi:hypothetical protein
VDILIDLLSIKHIIMEISILSTVLILIVFATIIMHLFYEKIDKAINNKFIDDLIILIFSILITITIIIIIILSILKTLI